MKQYITLLALCLSIPCFSQLQDGAIAPDFNFRDIDGNQQHLYSYLSQGKTVILNFSEAWCPVCWNFHQSGVLQEFYNLYGPDGTDEAMVLFIEQDSVMGMEDLLGMTPASAGNWVNGTPFPIIDTSAANPDFLPEERPTIYGIYPDKTTFHLGRQSLDEYYTFVQDYTGEILPFDTLIKVNVDQVLDERCAGNRDGSISLSVDGPGTTYNYIWNTGQVTEDINGLSAGTFRVTITDNLNNRHVSNPITLSSPDSLALSFITTTPTSETAMNGALTVDVNGGTIPYNYIWNDGSTGFMLENLGEGTYTVQVTDANGCQIEGTATIEVPECSVVLSINVEPTSCDENPDGEINILVSGAEAPVSYNWSNGDTTRNISELASGPYELTVTDGRGCSATVGGIVDIEDNINPVARIREPFDLYLDETGFAELSAIQVDSGSFDNCGILDMQIEQTTFTCTDLGRQFLEFTVIDNNLNITSRDFEVRIVDTIEPYFICRGDTTVAACNGVVNYELPRVIDNCPQGPRFTQNALGPGATFPVGTTTESFTYVSNGGQTQLTCSFDVTVESIIAAEVRARDATCPGESNGSATVDIEQSDRFDFEWSDGQVTQTAINLAAGVYNVTIDDGAECRFVEEIFIGEPVALDVDVDSIKALDDDDLADVYISVSGGTPPYRYEWVDDAGVVSNVQDPQNLEFGSYDLTVMDANDCSLVFSVQVDETTPIYESNLANDLILSPNPTNGVFILDFPEDIGPTAQVKVSGFTGRRIYQTEVSTRDQARIDPGNMAPGVYLVTVWSADDTVTRRLVVR